MFIRGLLAIVVGYVISAATWLGVVGAIFGEGALEPDRQKLIFSFGALLVGAAVGGFAFTLIVGVANSPAIYVTIGLLAVMLGRSLYMGDHPAPDWYLMVGFISLAFGFLIGASGGAYRLDRR